MTECNSPKSPDGKHKEISGVSNRGFDKMSTREIIRDGQLCTEIRIDKYAFRNIICFNCGMVLAEGYSEKDAIFIDYEMQYAYDRL